MADIVFTVHIFREGDVYVAYVPELDVSSCGETPDLARQNIRDAVRGFLETSEEMGTLADVLQQAWREASPCHSRIPGGSGIHY